VTRNSRHRPTTAVVVFFAAYVLFVVGVPCCPTTNHHA